MLTLDDINEMDEDDIATFVREQERISDLTGVVEFAQDLREYALDEIDHRESGNVTRDDA